MTHIVAPAIWSRIVLTLTAEGESIRGTFDRPTHLSSNNGIFAGMRGGVRHDPVVRSHFADGILHLTIQNADDATDQDSYAMVVKGNRAELTFDDVPAGVVMQPYVFERAPGGATVATDWEPNRAYAPGDSDAPSAEMKAIFDEDRRVRSAQHTDWQQVSRTDAERRKRESCWPRVRCTQARITRRPRSSFSMAAR